ncbi:MAG: DUF4136 domain-containing protein [Planctomycetota bacterium]
MAKQWIPRFVVLAGLFVGLGCSSPASVSVQYDPDTDFQRFTGVAWSDDATIRGAAASESAASLAHRVQASIERSLIDRGFRIASEAGPEDLIARCNLVIINQQTVVYGGHPRNMVVHGTYDAQVFIFDEGTLLLEFIDPNSGEAVWSATVHGNIDARVRDSEIDTVIERALAGFPPGRASETQVSPDSRSRARTE